MQSSRHFTCLMCDNDISYKKIQSHYDTECEQFQLKKLGILDFEENQEIKKQQKYKKEQKYGKNGNKSKIKNLSDKNKAAKQPYTYQTYKYKEATPPLRKYQKKQIKQEQQKKNDYQGWKQLHKKQHNPQINFIERNKKLAWKQKPNHQSKNQKPSALAPKLQQNKVACIKCKKMVPFQSIDTHEFSCSYQIDCSYCGQSILVLEINEHQKKCIIKKQLERQQKKYHEYKDKIISQFYGNDEQLVDIEQYDYVDPEQQEQQQQGQWQHYQGYSESNQKQKHKGLSNNKLNSLPLVCYRKSSIRGMAKNHSKRQKQQKAPQQQQQQQQQVCSICYLNFQQDQTVMKLKCLHYFHPQCVGKWFENDNRCPLCKKNVV